jgi:hypothetical protein
MINWFKNRKAKKEIEKFEKILSGKLGDIYPSMKELRNNSKLLFHSISKEPVGINLTYSMNPDYYERHGKKHRVNFKVDGFEIKRKGDNKFVGLSIIVTHDLIGTIQIDNPIDFWNHYDFDQLKIKNPVRTDLEFSNEDEKKLKKILKNIEESLISKIEIDNTFEIELDSKKYDTILDMEEGNYIGVNGKGQVFRLSHDSDEQVKMIEKSVAIFLTNYSGNKKDLVNFFD